MKYYISDLHFGHQSILSLCNRPFQSVSDMNKTLIKNWNQKVTAQDDIYIIGDLFYEAEKPEDILSELNGKKHLILGNHESRWYSEKYRSFFKSVQSSLEIVDQNHAIFLCHYPMVSYPKQSRAYMIHGHIHNDTLFDYWSILLKRERILNAGADINHFEPVTFNELIFNNKNYKQFMKESYPINLLSIRFHLHELKQSTLTKENLYQRLTDSIKEFIHPYREGLYQISQLNQIPSQIQTIRQEIKHDSQLNTLVKNFDVVQIDEDGNYSYLDYLNKESIYLK